MLILIPAGAVVDLAKVDVKLPFFFTVWNGMVESVRTLLRYGVDGRRTMMV